VMLSRSRSENVRFPVADYTNPEVRNRVLNELIQAQSQIINNPQAFQGSPSTISTRSASNSSQNLVGATPGSAMRIASTPPRQLGSSHGSFEIPGTPSRRSGSIRGAGSVQGGSTRSSRAGSVVLSEGMDIAHFSQEVAPQTPVRDSPTRSWGTPVNLPTGQSLDAAGSRALQHARQGSIPASPLNEQARPSTPSRRRRRRHSKHAKAGQSSGPPPPPPPPPAASS
jgi:hypothetical protein